MILKQFLDLNKWLIISFVFLVSFSISIFKGWRVSNPSDDRYIYLFEKYTETKFPETAVIIDKKILTGFNDGWEAAVVKVDDRLDFFKAKRKILNKKHT